MTRPSYDPGRRLQVLQLLLSPRIGGAETLASMLGDGLRPRGIDVRTAYLDPRDAASTTRLARISRLRTTLAEARPDVVLSHSALPNLYSRIVARGIPCITVLHSATHDFDDLKLRIFERLLSPRTSLVIAVSEHQAAEYRSHFGRRRVVVVPNGIRDEFFPASVPPEGAPRIVCAARLTAQKDPVTWLAACRKATELHSRLECTWWGPGDDSDAAAREVLTSHIAAPNQRIHFPGAAGDVAEAMRGAHVYFHTATREAHPIALLEAAASGLPIVCTKAVADTLPTNLPAATF